MAQANVGDGETVVNGRPQPAMRLGEIWSVSELCRALKVSERTWERWAMAGLPVYRAGTKTGYVLSDEVLAVMRIPPDQLPDYVPQYKRARKK